MSWILLLVSVALAGDRPTTRVPSPDRDEPGATGSAPAPAPAEALPAEAVPAPAPAEILAAAIPAETETGPGCLKPVTVVRDAEATPDTLYNSLSARLVNACGQPVISYAGAITFSSQKGPISQSFGIYSAGGVPLEGAQARWRFRVLSTAEDIWLYTAPAGSMSWSWTPGYVLLADGTVYRSEAKLPDARR